MNDQPLFDLTGADLKDIGTAQALEAVPDWTARAQLGIRALARSGREFTSEDLVGMIGLPRPDEGTNRNNAVGAAFSGAARRHEIRRVGYRPALARRSHARVLAVWVGTT